MTRSASLLQAMTLEEKIGQLTMLAGDFVVTGPSLSKDYVSAIRNGRAGSLLNVWGRELTREIQRVAVAESRLGIPLLFGLDVLHGHRTIFPIPLGEAAAFDPDLWKQTAAMAATEAAAEGVSLTFAPMLDISRDPRWGRMAECPGEDPWLASRFAEAKVDGFQREAGGALLVAATAKHIGGYGAVTAGRDYASVDISERTLAEVYLPPFRAAVDSKIAALMPAFSDLAGVPMTANARVLRDALRSAWGFDGVVISDFNAIPELMSHGVAATIEEAAALAIKAGIDIDMMGMAYARGLPGAVARDLVSMGEVDAAVRRVLALKTRLGLFDDPYRLAVQERSSGSDEHARRLAREVGSKSIVLLSNRNNVLPLVDEGRSIAVIGPLADSREDMLGPTCGAGTPAGVVTIVDGLRRGLPQSNVVFAWGIPFDTGDTDALRSAVGKARAADIVVLCLGERASMAGEAASRARPELPPDQKELAEAIFALGKSVVVVLSSGRPLTLGELGAKADAVLATWFLGCEAGNAIADVLAGRHNPSGRLAVTWPRDVGQVPIFYAQRPSGRPASPSDHFTSKYIDMPTEPEFPFGHGLSYTKFSYSRLRVSASEFRSGDPIDVEVDIANEGTTAGEETAFLFVHDLVASIARPQLELRGVAKIRLEGGEKGIARFRLEAQAFSFLGHDLKPTIEPGEVEILVGPCAEPTALLKLRLRLRC
jgi:beta-glucosidase